MSGIEKNITKQSGFTLIEVMVVVAIIGIVSAIAVPSYFSYRPTHDLNRAVREYHNLLHKAKMTAIKDRGSCEITFTATSYTVVCDDRDPPGPLNTCTFVKTVDLATDYNSDLVFKNHPGGGNPAFPAGSVTFNATGEASQGYLHFHHNQRNDDFYRVGPLISGVIILEHWTGADWE